MQLSKETIRTAMLAAQGLHSPKDNPAEKDDILPTIRQMGYLQIDTIQAVRRSQYLVLWSRLGTFNPSWLDEIHAEGKLFEYYAHALCYIPIEDFPIFRGMILYDDCTGNGWHEWAEKNPDVIQHVRALIKEMGALTSSNFNSHPISTGWGNVKQEKLALQRMFHTGELMVPYRKNFRRYYDLRERVLPDWDDDEAIDPETGREELILKAVRALGVAREEWIPPYYYLPKTGLSEVLDGMVAEGQLFQIPVDDWEDPAYVHPDQMKLVEAAASYDITASHTTLLSPFDPLISDRNRASALFNFDYKMESYTPAKDRKYGYFCLPILHQGHLIGRLDPKAYRKNKLMEFKKIFLEPDIVIDNELVIALKKTLAEFTAWHGMKTLEISETEPPDLRGALV